MCNEIGELMYILIIAGDMHILFVEGDNEHWLQVLPHNLSAPCCLREEGNVLPGCARSVIGDLNLKFIGAFSL